MDDWRAHRRHSKLSPGPVFDRLLAICGQPLVLVMTATPLGPHECVNLLKSDPSMGGGRDPIWLSLESAAPRLSQ